jgi:hypothetical protein
MMSVSRIAASRSEAASRSPAISATCGGSSGTVRITAQMVSVTFSRAVSPTVASSYSSVLSAARSTNPRRSSRVTRWRRSSSFSNLAARRSARPWTVASSFRSLVASSTRA